MVGEFNDFEGTFGFVRKFANDASFVIALSLNAGGNYITLLEFDRSAEGVDMFTVGGAALFVEDVDELL